MRQCQFLGMPTMSKDIYETPILESLTPLKDGMGTSVGDIYSGV